MKNIFTILVVIGCISCADNNSKVTEPAVPQPGNSSAVVSPDSSLLPAVFDTLPASIGGCGEYMAFDSVDYGSRKYIFLSNLSQFALIKINGKTIRLIKQPAQHLQPDAAYTAVYQGNGYTATLKLQQTKQYDEGGFYQGTLEIAKGATSATYRVHGESGC